jgi:hypothetical protein
MPSSGLSSPESPRNTEASDVPFIAWLLDRARRKGQRCFIALPLRKPSQSDSCQLPDEREEF